MLVLKPVRNVLRFICIDCRSNVYAFEVCTGMNLTFFNIGHWPLDGGWRLATDRGRWDIRYPQSLEVLRQMIEEALPEMRRVTTIDEFVTYQTNRIKSLYRSSLRPNGLALIAIANGDLEKAPFNRRASHRQPRDRLDTQIVRALEARKSYCSSQSAARTAGAHHRGAQTGEIF